MLKLLVFSKDRWRLYVVTNPDTPEQFHSLELQERVAVDTFEIVTDPQEVLMVAAKACNYLFRFNKKLNDKVVALLGTEGGGCDCESSVELFPDPGSE